MTVTFKIVVEVRWDGNYKSIDRQRFSFLSHLINNLWQLKGIRSEKWFQMSKDGHYRDIA